MEGGRSRTGKLRPPRYGLLAYVAEAIEQRPRRRRLPRAGVDHLRPAARGRRRWPPSRAGRRRRARGWRGSPATPARSVAAARHRHVRFAEPISLREALADEPRAAAGAAEGGVRGLRRDQPGHPGHGDGAGHPRPAGGARPRADARAGARRCSVRCCELPGASAGCRGAADALAHRGRACGGVLGALASSGSSRSTRAARSRCTRSSAASTSWPPSTATARSTTSSTARSPSWCCCAEPDGPLGRRRCGPARPAEVRVLLPRPRRPTARRSPPSWRRLGAGWDDAPTAAAVLAGAAFLIAHRVLRSFVDAQLVVAERLAARDPRTPVVEKEFLDECAARRAADAAAGTAARAGVALARAVRQRAEARRQPRPRR